MMAADCGANPVFCAHSVAYVVGCDGSYFAGNTTRTNEGTEYPQRGVLPAK